MKDYSQIRSVIKTIAKMTGLMERQRFDIDMLADVDAACMEINRQLYQTQSLKFQKKHNLEDELEYQEYVLEIKKLLECWESSVCNREANPLDEEFWMIYDYFKYVDSEEIYNRVQQYFMSLPEGFRIEFLSLPKRYTFLTGRIDIVKNDFSLIRMYVEMMADEIEKYKWFYEHLADYRSKQTLNGIIRFWFQFNVEDLHRYTETIFSDYYDLDILQCGKDDVLVDLGAYTGDSIQDYINTYGVYKKIYAYEITPGTYRTLISNLSGYADIEFRQKGVGEKNEIMYVNDKKDAAGNKILDTGDTEVEVVCLDEDIQEAVSVVKMDIEGAETGAILGMQRHIKEEKPKLLISTYHIPSDMFEIPYMLHNMRDDYKFYLRFNGRGIWPCDYVLFAI